MHVCIYTYINLYIYTYTCMYMPTYIHIYIYISTYLPPRFARRVWPGCKFCFSTFALRLLLIAYIRGFRWCGRKPDLRSRSPREPPSKIIVFATRPCKYLLFRSVDPSCNSHTNLICCSSPMSNLLFTFSLSCKSIIFTGSFKILENAKATLLKHDKDYHQNWSTRASKFTSRNHVFGIMSSSKS